MIALPGERVAVLREDDSLRRILAQEISRAGFEPRLYPPSASAWIIPADAPLLVVLHAPRGGAHDAIAFLQALVLYEIPRPPILIHADEPERLYIPQLDQLGVRLVPTAAPLSVLLEALVCLAGEELLRRQPSR